MSLARELAGLLRAVNVRGCGEPGFESYELGVAQIENVLRRAAGFLDTIASREEDPAAGEAEVVELRRVHALGAEAPMAHPAAVKLSRDTVSALDELVRRGHRIAELEAERARDKARIAAALAVVEEWHASGAEHDDGGNGTHCIARVKEALTK